VLSVGAPIPGIGSGSTGAGAGAGAGAIVAGFAFRGADRFLAFFAAGLRAAAFFAAFFFLRAGAARFIFFDFDFDFDFAFDFFRFFAMIDLPIVAALVSVQSGLPAPGCIASSCKARVRSVPLTVPPRRSAPQRR
jgi:hypothetical protein